MYIYNMYQVGAGHDGMGALEAAKKFFRQRYASAVDVPVLGAWVWPVAMGLGPCPGLGPGPMGLWSKAHLLKTARSFHKNKC